MSNTCPVCGYGDDEKFEPRDYTICGCCGTEFGYDDFTKSHAELRAEWIAEGAKWWSKGEEPPPNWNAKRQLEKAGFASE